MPTANPADSAQPGTREDEPKPLRRARPTRFIAAVLAVPIALTFGAADPVAVEANAARKCSKWHSLTQPPTTIRVLRRKSGRIEVVNFRRYVLTVMGKEWPSYLPLPVVAAGAVAVKQFAWYHAVYSRRAANGRCFDVRDSTADQLYKPNRSRVRPDHHVALAMTWGTTLRKHGRFLMTGYRRGGKARCGRDVTGWKLFAKSAVRCAEKGWGWQQILRKYYGPGATLVVRGGGGGGGARLEGGTQPAQAWMAGNRQENRPTARPDAGHEAPLAPAPDAGGVGAPIRQSELPDALRFGAAPTIV